MASRADTWGLDPTPRYLAGVGFGARSGRMKVAVLRCFGEGWNFRVQSAEALTLPPPPEGEASLANSIDGTLRQLCGQGEIPFEEVDALGLHGIPDSVRSELLAACVAERTGVTVVAGFELGDLAVGGRGGPLAPILNWLLFRSTRFHRLFVQLSAAGEVAYFPANSPAAKSIIFQAGPGCEFLDGFTLELSQRKYPFDPGGHLAVQGSPHEPLIENWMSHPYLLQPPPKLLGTGDFDASLREDSIAFARERRLSAADVLCSANHFIVRAVRESIHRWLPAGARIDEVWVGGGGVRNGLLWKLLRDQFLPIPIARTDDLGLPAETLPAFHAALLGYLALEHLPGNLPQISGARCERVLGQITPGSPENWDRWVCNLADRFDVTRKQVA